MSNLLEETTEAIEDSGHKITDIVFIGNEEGYGCTWDEFKSMANKEYDDGFGAAEVATDLKIVFSDGSTMYREEYDGSEWWKYSRPFDIPKQTKPIKRLIGAYWPSLENLQDDKDYHHNPDLNTVEGDKKLYELPRDKDIKIYGFDDSNGDPVTIIFGHIDGAYSYCWFENSPEDVVHLSASTPLKAYKDGYKVILGKDR